jgi:hypothetical protein
MEVTGAAILLVITCQPRMRPENTFTQNANPASVQM